MNADLLDAKVIAEMEQRDRRKAEGHSTQIASLQKQIDNLTDAIANGLLAASLALPTRLAAAEAEFARLTNERKVVLIERSAPNVPERYRALAVKLVDTLSKDVERARAAWLM